METFWQYFSFRNNTGLQFSLLLKAEPTNNILVVERMNFTEKLFIIVLVMASFTTELWNAQMGRGIQEWAK